VGPYTLAADHVHAMKYRQSGETFCDCANRVASALKDSDEHYHKFREILQEMPFITAPMHTSPTRLIESL
jgi:ribonucleoside-diphosphate reductase alpha chain